MSQSRNSPAKSCCPRPRRVHPIDNHASTSSYSQSSPRLLSRYPTAHCRHQLKSRTPVLLGRRRNGVGIRTTIIILVVEARNATADADVARRRLCTRGPRVDTIGGVRGRGEGMGTISRRSWGEPPGLGLNCRSLGYHGQAPRGAYPIALCPISGFGRSHGCSTRIEVPPSVRELSQQTFVSHDVAYSCRSTSR